MIRSIARGGGKALGLYALCGFVLACTPARGPNALAEARLALQAGQRTLAYSHYVEAVCGGAGLDAGRELVALWDELGHPGTPLMRLDACHVRKLERAYVAGLVAALAGNPTQAQALLQKASTLAEQPPQRNATRAEIAYRRALVALDSSRLSLAEEQLTLAADFAPERCDVRLALARLALANAEPQQVPGILKGLLALRPSTAEIRRGRMLLTAAARAAEPPLDAVAAAKSQRIFSAAERGSADVVLLSEALQLAKSHEHPRTLLAAGMVALELGDTAQGRELLSRAAELAPLAADAPRALGISLFAAERVVEALPFLREANRRDPLDTDLARLLAKAARTTGSLDVAVAAELQLTVLEPTVAEHHLWLARLERQRGHLLAARRAAERGQRINEHDIPLLLERANIETELWRQATTPRERALAHERAEHAVHQLLEVSPDNPGARAIVESLGG